MNLFVSFSLLIRVVLSVRVALEPISTLYLPYQYNPERYALHQNAAEQAAYDAENKLLYSVGNTNIHVIDLSNVSDMTVLYHNSYDGIDVTDVEICGDYVFITRNTNIHVIDLSNVSDMTVLYHSSYDGIDVTDVDICGDYVYITMDNQTERENGMLVVFSKFDRTSGSLPEVTRIVVGAVPDMVLPTNDCRKVLIAVEGEAYLQGDRLIDPEGMVAIVTVPSSPSGNFTLKQLHFTVYNDRVRELEQTGVRFVYRENNNTFSNDVEPECITLSSDGSKAYVALQENNAIAVIDLESETITGVVGLGFKLWELSTLDVSDKDGGIHMLPWQVQGMYQPDSIQVINIRGTDYIVMCNEGDSKDYGPWSEESRVKDLELSDSFESNSTDLASLIRDSALGRLKVTTQNGRNTTTGKYDTLYSFGGRSFSIRRADTMELVFDSQNDIGRHVSLTMPYLFNANVDIDLSIQANMDIRSDDKGTEPESLMVAELEGHTVLIVGNERPGILAVYSIDHSLPTVRPKFEGLVTGIPQSIETTGQQYTSRTINMVDPEDIRYVSREQSPINEPIIIVSGSSSGTITVLKMIVTEDQHRTPESNAGTWPHHSQVLAIFIVAAALLKSTW